MQRIYMDANATTPLAAEVFEAMRPWMTENFGNASSIHHHGQRARAAVERARVSVAALLHCTPAEVVFTSGGTEGDNLALFGLLKPGDHLITSSIEHHAVLHAAQHLEQRGVEVTYLPVGGDCLVDPGDLRRALRPDTRLLSIMMANNETGAIQPAEEIGKIAADAGVLFHTDAVQAAAKLVLDVQRLGCAALTIAGHKMYGPQGVGALYMKRSLHIEPLFYGGAHERQRRAGTENVAGIVGLGKAADLAATAILGCPQPSLCAPHLSSEIGPGEPRRPAHNPSQNPTIEDSDILRITRLRDRLEAGILNQLAAVGVNAPYAPRVGNTTNLYFDHLDGEALFIALDLRGLAVSSGAACASGTTEPSHVLTAMGLTPARAKSSLRFSLTRITTEAEVDRAIELVTSTVARLRQIAPSYAVASG